MRIIRIQRVRHAMAHSLCSRAVAVLTIVFAWSAIAPAAVAAETLVVYSPRNEVEYRVKVAMPPAEREAAIQAELSELLQGGERGA